MPDALTAFWFRRDLRWDDNRGLAAAFAAGRRVLPVFIFDTEILRELPAADRRVVFIHRAVRKLDEEARRHGSGLLVCHGEPEAVWAELFQQWPIAELHANDAYEPYDKGRDQAIGALAQHHGAAFHRHKDHVIFHHGEVLKDDGTPYTVYTPYSKAWLAKLRPGRDFAKADSARHLDRLLPMTSPPGVPSLPPMGFREDSGEAFPSMNVPDQLLSDYPETRDYPAQNGTSRLSVHLRFGTLSIRRLAHRSHELGATKFLKELIWRDFYHMILGHFPWVVTHAFKPAYDAIPWRDDPESFERWKTGTTGFPMVDAGMRELNQTGYMHNRVRMVVASFLTKDLLIDWRWGEAYFAEKLLDYELSSNNGGWQWAAGSGVDSQAYYRIFNPILQQKKFDPEGRYVRRWIPELDTPDYPAPMLDHKEARKRALQTYKEALSRANGSEGTPSACDLGACLPPHPVTKDKMAPRR